MAEIKNSFIKSKMNKDLDDRLIPSGEYRDAENISVGRSEESDVGALENILGNTSQYYSVKTGSTCIGQYYDSVNNRIFMFLTDYTDSNPNQLTPAPPGSVCSIVLKEYDPGGQEYVLVDGSFLNFSTQKDFQIHSLNLIENQLFWTDNRNQPRKINVDLAIASGAHYKNEWQISVAKFAPIKPISLIKKVEAQADGNQTGQSVIVKNANSEILVGMTLVASGYSSCNFVQVTSVQDDGGDKYTLGLNVSVNVLDEEYLTFLISTMENKSEDPNWPGDPDYLEARYVRFSYRFKYEDNEYSTLAPFSQIAFIPKQKGYFIDGDERDAFRSTVIKWFENNINNISILLELPDRANAINSSYKITEVDFLYKESDGRAVKVLETIDYNAISQKSGDSNIYEYVYQSQKPYKTLAEDQTTRVYDKVPVRAEAQEVSGNRVMYGNYFEGWTPPSDINYKLTFQEKGDSFDNFIEYPNHTVKENRNYQVGIILADKYNRQSSVILSTLDSVSNQSIYKGSTIFAPYSTITNPVDVKCFNGNAIRMLVESVLSSNRDIPSGTPGLYAEQRDEGFSISSASKSYGTVPGSGTVGYWYVFKLDANFPLLDTVPVAGSYLAGEYKDYVVVTEVIEQAGEYKVRTSDEVNDSYLYRTPLVPAISATKFSYDINTIGWYSYKVVVRQQEQDYYNAFLPGMLRGYPLQQTFGSTTNYSVVTPTQGSQDQLVLPEIQHGINETDFPAGEFNKTAHVVLINDNINKIPRDLTEVGPDQTQYRSSEELYGRVENFESSCDLTAATGYLQPPASGILNYIEYDLNATDLPLCIGNLRPGDAVEASSGGNSGGSIIYPEDWYKNTVITEIDPEFELTTTDKPDQLYQNVSTIVLDGQNLTLEDWFTTTGAGVIKVTKTNGVTIAFDGVTDVTVSDVTSTNPTEVTFNTPIEVLSDETLLFTYPQGTGRIYFKPSQYVTSDNQGSDTAQTWTFYLEENRQYYPTRKADIVSTIADAKTLGFLPNSLDNVRGTSSLNFYNLETNPLIGRISTTQPIGVGGKSMVPFLSIYETKPVESQLEVFWETTTTGLISELNEDVQTGYDGIVGFTDLNYTHFENQDPQGTSLITGSQGSRFITDSFYAVDGQGTQQSSATISSFSVTDDDGNTRTSDFELIENYAGQTGQLRLAISTTSNFVFNNDAFQAENFNFTVNVTLNSVTAPFYFSRRLGNNNPEIFPTCTDYEVVSDQTNTAILVSMTGNNGSFSESASNLHWAIDPATNTSNYFVMTNNNNQGEITINQNNGGALPPEAVYNLTIELTDAWNYTLNQPTGTVNGGIFDSKKVSCDTAATNLDITIGAQTVDIGLQADYTAQQEPFKNEIQIKTWQYRNTPGQQGDGCFSGSQGNPNNQNSTTTPGSLGYGNVSEAYCGIYIGRQDILNDLTATPALNGFWNPLTNGRNPNAANSNQGTNVRNLLSIPTAITGVPDGFIKLIHLENFLNPQQPDFSQAGLSQGSLMFEVFSYADGVDQGQASPPGGLTCGSNVKWAALRRDLSNSLPNTNTWELVNNQDGYQIGKAAGVVSGNLGGGGNTDPYNIGAVSLGGGGANATQYAEVSTKFVLDGNENPGEYFIYFKMDDLTSSAIGCFGDGSNTGSMDVSFRDANYNYPNGPGTAPVRWWGPTIGGESSVYGDAIYRTGLVKYPGFNDDPVGIEFDNSSTNPQDWPFPTIKQTSQNLPSIDSWKTTAGAQTGLTLQLGSVVDQVSVGQGITLPNATPPTTVVAYVAGVTDGNPMSISLSNSYPFTNGEDIAFGQNVTWENYKLPIGAGNNGYLYANSGWAENLKSLYYDNSLTTPFQPVRENRYYSLSGGQASLTVASPGNYVNNRGLGGWQSGATPPNYINGANWEKLRSIPSVQVRLSAQGKLITDGTGIYKRYMQDITESSEIGTPGNYILWEPRQAILSGSSTL